MPIHDLRKHLEHYAAQQLATHGKKASRPYLKRCVTLWRERYGDQIADHMTRYIRALFAAKVKPQA